MPITITIEGASADEVRQLILETADMFAKKAYAEDIRLSTLDEYVPQTPQQTTQAQQPAGQAANASQTTTVVPTAPTAATPAPVTPAPTTTPTIAPTTAPQYDFNQLATATMQLQQAGQNIFELFQQFGIQALNQLPKERYAEYAAVLRQRGAKI